MIVHMAELIKNTPYISTDRKCTMNINMNVVNNTKLTRLLGCVAIRLLLLKIHTESSLICSFVHSIVKSQVLHECTLNQT